MATLSASFCQNRIPKAACEQIFDRTDRVKSNWLKGTPTGLGLPLSQMAIEAHGGKIWTESEIGQGKSFYFTIPLGKDSSVDRF